MAHAPPDLRTDRPCCPRGGDPPRPPRCSGRGAHSLTVCHGGVHGVRRASGDPLHDPAPGRPDRAGGPVHHVRLGRPRRPRGRRPGRPGRGAAAEPRRHRLREKSGRGLRPGTAARVAGRGVLAGPADRLAAHPQRGRTRRREPAGPRPALPRGRVMAAARRGRVVSLGVHIVDILGRPVSHIPPGQGRVLLDEIRVTAAGTAAGTSVDLAKLGAEVIAMGAIGDDLLADFLTMVLDRHGVATHLLARKSGVQTSATMLPIRPNGERPALHTPGATPTLTEADIDLAAIETADVLHIGGPDVLGRFGGAELCRVLEFARGAGVTTTMDVLSTGDATAWARLRPSLPFVDYFCPNEDQLAALTGMADLTDACHAVLAHGTSAVLVSRGAQGAALVTADRRADVPAFDV